MRPAILLLLLSVSGARADIATWFWAVTDTGNGDGVIEPGESALLTLGTALDPPQPQYGGMFGQSGPYDILGNPPWTGGRVEAFENLLDWGSGDGLLDAENSIRDIENFQYPAAFGDGFDNSNPIDLYFIRWTPGVYEAATVTLDNGGPDAWIYTDPFGHGLLYAGEGGAVSFAVVPAPATPLLVLTPFLGLRRKR